MTSFNKVILLGNLTRDPEIRYTPANMAVAGFGVAVNEKYKHEGQVKEKVTYLDIVVWGKSAENCAKYLSKGSSVLIEGKLQQRRWDDKDTGAKRSKIEVVASTVTFLGKPKAAEEVPHNVGQAFPDAEPVDEGEIPF